MVCGLGEDHHGYLLEDCSLRGQPHEWATAAVAAYHRHNANAIVAEVNQGGDMVLATIASVDGAESVACSQSCRLSRQVHPRGTDRAPLRAREGASRGLLRGARRPIVSSSRT